MAYDYILIDGMSLLHRAAHTYTLGFMKDNGEWVQTGPTFGFISMAIAIWEKWAHPQTQMIFCWDAGYEHRLALYPDYKLNRRQKKAEDAELDEDEKVNFKRHHLALRKILTVAGWRQAHAPGYEADDVLAALGRLLGEQGTVALHTLDQDLHQSVTDSVHVVSGKHGKEVVWTPVEVEEKWGFPPSRVAEIKGLIGDGGDNIPGCPGCGLGWAKKLFTQYGDVHSIIEAANRGLLTGEYNGKKWKTPSLTKKIKEHEAQILVSWELAKVAYDCPVSVNYAEPRLDVLEEALDRLRFTSMTEGTKWERIKEIAGSR